MTRGCTHNKCKFCTMYKGVEFGAPDMETIEADLRELDAGINSASSVASPVRSIDSCAKIVEELGRGYE